MRFEDALGDRHDLVVDEQFRSPTLDPDLWIAAHLPQWSSRERAAARYSLGSDGLELRVEADQPPWCPDHDATTRVSSLQTGVRSGPVGSTDGQHRFADDVVVTAEQPTRWLHTLHRGAIEVTARMSLHEHSMAALWLVGVEDVPEHSSVIDVVEVFGSDVRPEEAGVGINLKPFADPTVTEDLARPVLPIDVTDVHAYAVVWTADDLTFFVDGVSVRRVDQSPDHPMQLMLGVYAFDAPAPDAFVPRFTVRSVRSWAPRG